MRKMSILGICFFLIAAWTQTALPAGPAADALPRVVGRVYHIEGELIRYVPEQNDWVAVVKDAPFAPADTFYTNERSRAELILPNGTWLRAGPDTQIQFIALEADVLEADVSIGMARFYNAGSETLVKVTCPFGYVLADADTAFDIYLDDQSVEVVAVKGTVRFVHVRSEARYEIVYGQRSIVADRDTVSPGEGTFNTEWHRWNEEREYFWTERTRKRIRSAQYLPQSLHRDAYVLDEYGRWERLPYEGSYYWFWRPTQVAGGWSPYTVGRWTEWYGDQTWIPAEPFGYITHHYGNWIYMRNGWFWAPPVVSVTLGVPLLDIGYCWYPGRVSWVYRESYVGWVPLAPRCQ